MPLLFAAVAAIIFTLMKTPKLSNDPTLVEKKAFVSRMTAIARRVESEGAIDTYTGARIPPGIKADFGIALVSHESAYGISELAREAFNISGLTADPDSNTYWANRKFPVYQVVTEEEAPDMTKYKKTRSFRRYRNLEESYIDWARLLYAMYPESFAAAQTGDFAAFAAGLQQRGYATDSLYASKVLRVGADIQRLA